MIYQKIGNARKFKGIEIKGEKTCTKCMLSKSLNRFNISVSHVGGTYPWCMNCQSVHHKNWYANKIGRTLKEVGIKGKIVDDKKKCARCLEWKLIKDFYKNKNYKSGLTSHCIKCINSASRAFKYKETRRLKLKCMMGYGGKCSCCGETRLDLLTIEHIRGKGFTHIRESSSTITMKKLIELGFPEGHTCLCYNCNMSSKYMPCCHTKEYKEYVDRYLIPGIYYKQKELNELERKWVAINGKAQ